MKNQSNVYTKKVNQFERGGDVLAGKTVDNDVKIGAPDSTKHLKNHRVMGTARLGQLLPVDIMNVLPHDDYRVNLSNSVQFEPLYKPILDKLITKVHAFYVGYHSIFGDQFEMFWKGGEDGSYRRELPYYDMSAIGGGSTFVQPQVVFAIAFYSWSLSHHMSFNDVVKWCSVKDQGSWYWRQDRLMLIFNTVFGKGSLLDMFNLGVGESVSYSFDTLDNLPPYRVPTMIPVDRLLAYKLICNDFYRIEDYQVNRFNCDDPQDVIFTIADKVEFTSAASNHGYENLSLGARDFAFGVFFRNLDKVRTTSTDTYDFSIRGYDCHFSPSALSLHGTLTPGDTTEGVYLSRSCCALAWLLAVEPVPLPKDYLTMILPQTQRGLVSGLGSLFVQNGRLDNTTHNVRVVQNSNNVGLTIGSANTLITYPNVSSSSSFDNLFVNLDMETLRYVNAATKLAEKMNIVGENYGQQLLAEFGINPKFAHIDKPLYLGGLTSAPRVDKITSTANTESNIAVGSKLGEYAADASQFATGSYSFVADDHGFVITIMSTIPEVSYAGFIDRDAFAVFDRFNWFRKEFEDLTEQHLYVNEFKGIDTKKLAQMMAGRVAPTDADVIGYVPREQQRRTMLSTVHGELIPSKGPADVTRWTAARDFNGVNKLTTLDILFDSVESPQNDRLFQFNNIEFPPMTFECGFNVDVLSKVGRITLPITI